MWTCAGPSPVLQEAWGTDLRQANSVLPKGVKIQMRTNANALACVLYPRNQLFREIDLFNI